MNTLDRYIARLYLINTLTLLVLLFSFVIAVDVALNMHRFIQRAGELGGEGAIRRILVTILLVFDLWWPKLLQLYNFMIGLVLVGAMGFTFAQLVRNREFVAVLAGGISLRRMARPVLLVALIMTGVQVFNQELVLPRVAHLLTRDHGDAGTRNPRAFDVHLTRDSAGRIFLAGEFNPDEERITDLHVWERDDQGVATRRVRAATAVWRDAGWDLEGVSVMPFTSGADPRAPTRIESDIDPTVLLMRRYEGLGQSLSTAQLSKMRASPLKDRSTRDGFDRILFGRVSMICSNLLALIIAMPFYLMREPKNMVVQTLKCAPVAIGALMGGILGAAAPVPGLPAAVGVFLPVLALLPMAIATAGSLKT